MDILDSLGFARPVAYATATYGVFRWLDQALSDEAKAALAKTIGFRDYRGGQIASALVEAFDRIYTSPLLSWRAFLRSSLFTLIVSVIFAYEYLRYFDLLFLVSVQIRHSIYHWGEELWVPVAQWRYLPSVFGGTLLVNLLTDYISLFFIRRWLVRSGARPILALLSSALIGFLVVGIASLVRAEVIVALKLGLGKSVDLWLHPSFYHNLFMWPWPDTVRTMIPATIVFSWFLLFALGILIVRLLNPLFWLISKVIWAFKEEYKHPMRAIGLVAATAVFLVVAVF